MKTNVQANQTSDLSSEEIYYGSTARHYDPAYKVDKRLNDLPFYLELAKTTPGTVLEVACGTGRILLPTAEAGIHIDGLDMSEPLLGILRAKLAEQAPEIRERVTLYQGDMRKFDLKKVYDLITIPFRPLQHLLTIEDQLSAFECFSKHLRKGGRLAFNVFYPNYAYLDQVGIEIPDLEWEDPEDPSITVKRFFLRKEVNKLQQFFEGEFIFRSYRGEELLSEERSELRMSYYTYPQLLLLLGGTGFKVLEEYGSFNRDPISICNEMIIVAEKL